MKSVDLKLLEDSIPNIFIGDPRWYKFDAIKARLRFIRDILDDVKDEVDNEISETKTS